MSVLALAVTSVDYRVIGAIKLVVALVGTLLLAWDAYARRRLTDPHRRTRKRLIVLVSVLAGLCWWNLGRFHYPAYIANREHYHYYLGAKYFRELGYTRLYDCIAVADIEAGLGQEVATQWMRNLRTNELELGQRILSDPTSCTSHFTAQRWEAFKRDVDWFRPTFPAKFWREPSLDHGYNATPVWGIAGGLLAGLAPASTPFILGLSLIDPVLLILMFAVVWRVFGVHATCVAALWWGTNYVAVYAWTGGSLLRADWLLMATLGICFMKLNRPAASGFTLMFAALLRIFPVFIILALVLKSVGRVWRTRTLSIASEHIAFGKGCVIALAILVPASLISAGGVRDGLDAWRGFVVNSQKHLSTPLTNNMGLKTVVSYDLRSRAAELQEFGLFPWDTWMAARRQTFADRRLWFWALAALFLLVFARVASRHDDWVVLVLGVGLIPVWTQLTCYYYVVLLFFGFLSVKWPWTGVALGALSSVSLVVPALLGMNDDRYFVISIAVLVYVVGVTLYAARRFNRAFFDGDKSSRFLPLRAAATGS